MKSSVYILLACALALIELPAGAEPLQAAPAQPPVGGNAPDGQTETPDQAESTAGGVIRSGWNATAVPTERGALLRVLILFAPSDALRSGRAMAITAFEHYARTPGA